MCDLQKNTTEIWLVKLLREGIFFPWYHMYIWCAKKLFHKVKFWIAVAYRVFITFLRFKSPILSVYSLTLDFISLDFLEIFSKILTVLGFWCTLTLILIIYGLDFLFSCVYNFCKRWVEMIFWKVIFRFGEILFLKYFFHLLLGLLEYLAFIETTLNKI